eukprot:152787-Chlamydomonas_euryale.AAC.1
MPARPRGAAELGVSGAALPAGAAQRGRYPAVAAPPPQVTPSHHAWLWRQPQRRRLPTPAHAAPRYDRRLSAATTGAAPPPLPQVPYHCHQ